ncbi:hypothetical protein J5O04_05085 [Corynebacterium hindlerae]|uniref:DUF6928 family protein n=1 Tax=Corynebacterium hindlerae TaxID=699041 RepID=UPI001AD754F2|nr:hypothetical protein [Corynebacterium hindlerae]QTH60488.1 hypothetical protein J5O04_05085 [Corynebacterium hindlerae]
MQPHDAVVTLWFVNVSDPAAVLNAGPKADRGFGRKYLALMNPSWPISVFGEFPLNRSVSASKGEFYIAGYPGVTVVQTFLEEMTVLSELPTKLLNSIEARDVYAFAENGDTSFGGIAHWQGGELRRSFCARRDRVYEDIGLPEPFEAPLWAGEASGINLPFEPIDLVREADTHWLGIDISADGPDLSVVGYAVDGRKEPRLSTPRPPRSVSDMVESASTKLGLNPATRAYDDYEEAPDDARPDRAGQAWADAKALAKSARRSLRAFGETVKDKLRHTDRG